MTGDNFDKVWRILARRRPWLPFTLVLLNGSRVEVNHPESLTRQDGLLVCQSTTGNRCIFEPEAVVRVLDATG